MAWKMFLCATLIFLDRVRIRIHPTPACSQSSARRFWKKHNRWYSGTEQSRDFTFVENAVAANLLACEAPNASGKVFNIGTGARITLNQTLALLANLTGNKLETKYEPPRDGDIRDSQADIKQARDILSYEPLVSFEEGLRRTVEWYREAQAKALAKQKSEA